VLDRPVSGKPGRSQINLWIEDLSIVRLLERTAGLQQMSEDSMNILPKTGQRPESIRSRNQKLNSHLSIWTASPGSVRDVRKLGNLLTGLFVVLIVLAGRRDAISGPEYTALA
jgi:hypothetical protein